MPAKKTLEEHLADCKTIADLKGIEIIGIVKPFTGNTTKMINLCKIHGEWRTTTINKFKRGASCPKCGRENNRQVKSKTLKQYLQECGESNTNPHWVINGIQGEWKGVHTKLDCTCDLHGKWYSTSIDNFKRGKGCPKCRNEKSKKVNTKPDDEIIASFYAKRHYPEGTIFKRSKRLNSRGREVYWSVFCPTCAQDDMAQAGLCNGWFETLSSNLQEGKIPCRCSVSHYYTEKQYTYRATKLCDTKGYKFNGWVGEIVAQSKIVAHSKFKYLCPTHGEQIIRFSSMLQGVGCPQCAGNNQQECYINKVYDEEGVLCALKFGIANDSDRRIKNQNIKNVFIMQQSQVWKFPTVKQCKYAERMCKKKLDTKVITKYSMPDGYTETVEVSCLASIQNIYKTYGGTLQEEIC